MATVMAQATAMRVTVAQRPSRGASSARRTSRNRSGESAGLASADMMHFDRGGHPHVHRGGGRVIEPHPDREALRHHHPVQIAADLWQSRSVLFGGLHTGADALHATIKGNGALGHRPD